MARSRLLSFFTISTLLILMPDGILSAKLDKFSVFMPNFYPYRNELNACHASKLAPNKTSYIVGFEPHANASVVHHMMVFGCKKPGSTQPVWNCGEMETEYDVNDTKLEKAHPCVGDPIILFSWALDAKKLELPKDVGFKVGANTDIDYIVIQVHYQRKLKEGTLDTSGITLIHTEKPQPKLAGVVLVSSNGEIPAKSIVHLESACEIKENKTIHPFAYRVHTHELGRVVAGYSVRRDSNGKDQWTLIGKRNPNTPQMFYPTFTKEPITYKDRLAARCTMNSDSRTNLTRIGPKHEDEMCNFYTMYYVNEGNPLDMKYCVSYGPPKYSWAKEKVKFNNVPEQDASTLD